MKNFAKLMLVFSVSFLFIFFISTVFRFLVLRVDWAKNLPVKPETTLTLIIAAAHWALSLTLFSSILFSLNYAVRKEHSALMYVTSLIVLSFVFCLGFSVLLDNWNEVPPAQVEGIPLGDKGIILTRNETSIVLLNGTAEPLVPRVISIPGQPLLFQSSMNNTGSAINTGVKLPPVPFTDDLPWSLKSLAIDIRLNSELFKKYYNESFGSFLLYAGSLIVLLCSFGNLLKFSVWPLANLFVSILVFRGILAFEIFLNSYEIQNAMESFLKGAFPVSLAIPFIFLGLGVLLHLYSILISLSKRRFDDGY